MNNFKNIVIREKLSSRGGGVEIDLTSLGFEGHKMSAYQNYLGGGILSSIQSNDTIRYEDSNIPLQLEFSDRFKDLDQIAEDLKYYFASRMGFDSIEYEQIQKRPSSAY